MNNFIKQSFIADKLQRKTFLNLVKAFKKDKSVKVTMVHDSIIISKQLMK